MWENTARGRDIGRAQSGQVLESREEVGDRKRERERTRDSSQKAQREQTKEPGNQNAWII